MKYIIDTNSELSPDLQWFLYLIKEGKTEEANKFETENSPFEGNPIEPYRDKLIRLGYLVSTDKVNKLKKSKVSTLDALVEEIVDLYLDKFKNKKTGVAGDKPKVIKKLKAFFEEYPKFADKDIVLSATTRYINSCARSNFQYLVKAHYFIYKDEKDGFGASSQLANFCEEVDGLSNTTVTDNYDVG
jgi:hypothetical protein